MLYAIAIVLGLLFGGALSESFAGAVAGALLSVLWLRTVRSNRRIATLERELETLKTAPAAAAPQKATVPTAPPSSETEPMPAAPRPAAQTPSSATSQPLETQPAVRADTPSKSEVPREPTLTDKLEEALRDVRAYLLGVNTVVQVGVLVLLVGVGLLGKWAADNSYFPIEARLALAAAFGIGLVAIGFRTRLTRAGFGVTLQGGGIGIIYLVTFFAFRTYALIDAAPAFGALVVLTGAAVLLALLQNAKALAVIGAVGGFMAPVVASTGTGSHVALFSYFALLNAGIVTVAWFKAWRELNLVGFVFTFAIGGLWGAKSYAPELYLSTQAFLILFVLMFTAIPVLYAWRQAPKLRGLLDGTLVFGVPILAFAYQARIVEDIEFGLAGSSIGLAVLYVVLASVLYRLAPDWTRALVEAFVALGLGFATMTIPFALDAEWTALGWSLEGIGLVWIGLRQSRRLPRLSGMLLQLGAAFAVPFETAVRIDPTPVLNAGFFSAFSIAFSGLAVAYLLHRARDRLHPAEAFLSHLFFIWGALWWYGTLLVEAGRFVDTPPLVWVSLSVFTGSALLADLVARRSKWPAMRVPSFALVPIAFVHLLLMSGRPSAHLGWILWPAVIAAAVWVLRRSDWVPSALTVGWHAAILSLVASVLGWESFVLVDEWVYASFAWPLALHLWVILATVRFGSRLRGSTELRDAYGLYGPVPLLGYSVFWILAANAGSAGSAFPLPTVPLLNPFDITQALAVLTAVLYFHSAQDRLPRPVLRAGAYGTAAVAFYALTASLIRAIHHTTGVRYSPTALWDSVVVQAGVSIFWTLIALGAMVVATQRKRRTVWLVAASLLGFVVIKLFLVDLSALDTIARIVSFLVVGILMLLVGYLSPVPPAEETD